MYRRRLLLLIPLLFLGACVPDLGTITGQVDVKVNKGVIPIQATVPDVHGTAQPVAGSVDAKGIQSDFIEGVVLVHPKSDADLQAFISRYDGTVISNDAVPEPPASLGMKLADDQRKPTEYVVRIDLSKVDSSELASNAAAAGLTGRLEFSSEGGLQTFAVVADAKLVGFDVSPDYVSQSVQAFPATLFNTQERPNSPPPGFTDAFATTRFQTGGSQTNVTLAWQFLAAHGIQRRVQVAIIDDGFWLNTNGTSRGTDSDLPANPVQYDFVQNDYFADGAGVTGCGASNPCFWHGTGSAGVATGIVNNSLGDAGTGGLVADPILLRTAASRSNKNWAIRTAIAWGADVVSMSWGGDCNLGCRIYDREHTPFDDAIDGGSRAVFVAAAGNGDSAGNGYDVGDDHFFHPCIEDHVICVGALNDDATSKIGYSNFGGRVAIFAPTNIPVMSQPASNDNNPGGAAVPRSFGGTSASTPFVAGVAAMMKAINPGLNNDQVSRILIETAHPGSGQVTRYIDAYAAVRRAADGIPAVTDRFGSGGSDTNPIKLAAAASYNEPNLNLRRPGDLDWFQFEAPGSSTITVDLQYPEAIANVSLFQFEGIGECAAPVFVSNTNMGGRGRRVTYTGPGGPYRLAVRGDDINAYNLVINFSGGPAVAPDSYEVNNTPATARNIYSYKYKELGGKFGYLAIDPRVTIDATLHSSTDIDYYIVRGATLMGGEKYFMISSPTVRVYGNDAPISMEVYRLNADNTPGPLLQAVGGGSCSAQPVSVVLEEDKRYMLRVSGSPGRYKLFNGVLGKFRRFPQLVIDELYKILHPGDPIEYVVHFADKYAFVADRAYYQIRTVGQSSHVRLLGLDGVVLTEGLPTAEGELLSLALTVPGQMYALEIAPRTAELAGQTMSLQWDAAVATGVSNNLIVNGDGEANLGDGIAPWTVPLRTPSPRAVAYSDEAGYPSPSGAGPNDRGEWLFGGGSENTLSRMRQMIAIDNAWRQAINAGTVNFRFSAFLGGVLNEPDNAEVIATFIGANQETLGQQALPSITPLERQGQTGLLPVEASDVVPVGTVAVVVNVIFHGGAQNANRAFADNLELVLSSYAQ